MAAEAESADTDTSDDEERESLPWVNQTPHTRLSGVPTGLIYAGDIDDRTKQNSDSYGLILRDPQVEVGSLWANTEKPDEGTMDDADIDDVPRPTDYRVVDTDDETANTTDVGGQTILTTGEKGPSSYESADAFDEDEIIVWYNGMSGQRLGRVLDFNGLPFADWTDDGSYLVKGLYQPPTGWADADGGKRREMAKSSRAPRVVRPPILRNRVEYHENDDGDVVDATLLDEARDEAMLIDLSRYRGGDTYEMTVLDHDAFVDTFDTADATIPRTDGGNLDDVDAEIEWAYSQAADEVLEQAGYSMRMFTGEDFPDEPSGWQPSSTSEVDSFGIEADTGGGDGDDGDDTDDEGFSATQQQFVEETADAVRGSGMAPDEMFDGGLSGLIDRYESELDSRPDEAEVRETIYAEVAHLDVSSLDE
jgi:hypothetical protein